MTVLLILAFLAALVLGVSWIEYRIDPQSRLGWPWRMVSNPFRRMFA